MNRTLRITTADIYSDLKHFTSHEDLLADGDIDGVAIATPAETHYEIAREALMAGKHVLCGKAALPLGNARGGIKPSVKKNDLVLMVGHLLQYHPAFLKLKDMVDRGELGKVQYIYSNRFNLGKIRREENILWSFAPHDISMILFLAGAMPESVTTSGGNYLNAGVADVTMSCLTFANRNKHTDICLVASSV